MSGALAPAADPAGTPAAAPTVPGRLVARARRHPDAVALRHKAQGRWHEETWASYARRVGHVAEGLRTLGVDAGDRVAIVAGNRPAWLIADLAAQSIGAVTVGVHATGPAPDVGARLAQADAAVVVVEDEEQLDKALAARAALPSVHRVVVVEPRGVRLDLDPWVSSFAELEATGERATIDDLAAAVDQLDPGAPATIAHTAGATGEPRGVVLSHAGLVAAGDALVAGLDLRPGDEVLSSLPLDHLPERLVAEVAAVAAGYAVNFGERGATMAADLREVRPTVVVGVPRVWQQLVAGVEARMVGASRLKRWAYRWALAGGRRLAPARQRGALGPGQQVSAALTWVVLTGPLHRRLGLARVRVALSLGAPLAPDVLAWCWAIGLPVREAYSLTEAGGIVAVTPAGDVRPGAVGPAVAGVEVRVAPDGEVRVRGPVGFLGYHRDPAATAAATDADGWLRTGDRGVIDADGHLTVTGRAGDVIAAGSGVEVALSPIEGRLAASPFIHEAVVAGDGRGRLVALVVVDGDVAGAWAAQRGVPYTTYGDLVRRPEVAELVAGEVARVSAELPAATPLAGFRVLPRELDEDEGEVTATGQVRRAVVQAHFAELIESMAAEPGTAGGAS